MKTINYAGYAEFHVYERVVVMRDGRRIGFIGTISPGVIAAMTAQGVKVR